MGCWTYIDKTPTTWLQWETVAESLEAGWRFYQVHTYKATSTAKSLPILLPCDSIIWSDSEQRAEASIVLVVPSFHSHSLSVKQEMLEGSLQGTALTGECKDKQLHCHQRCTLPSISQPPPALPGPGPYSLPLEELRVQSLPLKDRQTEPQKSYVTCLLLPQAKGTDLRHATRS